MAYTLDYTGKRVLVTGSTMGIGRGLAAAFHAAGATVAVNGRSPGSVAKAIDEMGGGQRLIAAPGNLSTVANARTMVRGIIDAVGGLDVLVNNAGRGEDRLVDDVDEPYWHQMLDLNLKGVVFTTQACLPALRQSRGSVLNVASGLAVIGGVPGTAVYSATKTAVVQMTRMLALELATTGVRINALIPGWIDTPMIRAANEVAGANVLIDYIGRVTPLGRAGTPDEMAGAVLFMCSALAGFATGSLITIDGGLTAGHFV